MVRVDLFFAFTSVFDLFTRLWQQKTHFCLPTKVRFLNDVCLRQMMTATPNDVRFANDVCLAAHFKANIASLRNEVEQHHICDANASYRRKAMHHLKIYKAYALIYLRKCDIINSPINKNLTESDYGV